MSAVATASAMPSRICSAAGSLKAYVEPIGEDDTDRSDPATAQPRSARIGPGVADLLGEREQPIAQRRRQPLGTIEGVRRGRPRNAGGGRQVGQRRPPR